MSADNGIYILRTLFGGKSDGVSYEYRVAYTCAIENCNPKSPVGIQSLIQTFGPSEVHLSKSSALVEAGIIEDEIMAGPYPVLEYGISSINLDMPFPKTSKERN